jgi:hypothetical protein
MRRRWIGVIAGIFVVFAPGFSFFRRAGTGDPQPPRHPAVTVTPVGLAAAGAGHARAIWHHGSDPACTAEVIA